MILSNSKTHTLMHCTLLSLFLSEGTGLGKNKDGVKITGFDET